MKKMIWAVPTMLCLGALLAFSPRPEPKPIENAVALGGYSLSLNVKDISKSLVFYQKLGFEQVQGMGAVEQKWMILTNGEMQLGLFQEMFPENTLTFHPENGRAVYESLQEQGVEVAFAMGMEKSEGPCSFSILDPDGNPILIDQP